MLPDLSIDSNAALQMDQDYLFLTDDPNIYLRGVQWNSIKNIEVSFEFLDAEDMSVHMLKKITGLHNCRLSDYAEQMQRDFQAEIHRLQEELKKKTEEYDRCKKELNKKTEEAAAYMTELKELQGQNILNFIRNKLK